MKRKIFYPNGGTPTEISCLDDIRSYMGDSLDCFTRIEEDRNIVLAYHQNDPSPICIGQIREK